MRYKVTEMSYDPSIGHTATVVAYKWFTPILQTKAVRIGGIWFYSDLKDRYVGTYLEEILDAYRAKLDKSRLDRQVWKPYDNKTKVPVLPKARIHL